MIIYYSFTAIQNHHLISLNTMKFFFCAFLICSLQLVIKKKNIVNFCTFRIISFALLYSSFPQQFSIGEGSFESDAAEINENIFLIVQNRDKIDRDAIRNDHFKQTVGEFDAIVLAIATKEIDLLNKRRQGRISVFPKILDHSREYLEICKKIVNLVTKFDPKSLEAVYDDIFNFLDRQIGYSVNIQTSNLSNTEMMAKLEDKSKELGKLAGETQPTGRVDPRTGAR